MLSLVGTAKVFYSSVSLAVVSFLRLPLAEVLCFRLAIISEMRPL